MDANTKKALHIRVKSILTNLTSKGFGAAYVDTKEEALSLIKTLVPEDSKTAMGGSMTLEECGVSEYIKTKTNYSSDYLDAYNSDYYLASINALTDDGALYEVDGRGNRVSAILYGPKKVILVAGSNKLVGSITEAESRVKHIASPFNATRLSKDTPCAKRGICISPSLPFTDGCNSDDCICSESVTIRRCREKERIIVVIVGESLGY